MMKTLYGFGDSLVAGHCIGVGMLDALAEKHGLVYRKYAKNGAQIVPDPMSGVPDVAAQIKNASPEAPDLICFDGLTNDAWSLDMANHIGQLGPSFGCFDTTTFYGAFEQVCALLREKYRDSYIFYTCPHKMPTRDMELQERLQTAAREVCGKWAIPYVDVYRGGQINTCIDSMRQAYSYDTPDCLTNGNGTHLNAEGYARWYLPMLENALNPYL